MKVDLISSYMNNFNFKRFQNFKMYFGMKLKEGD